MTGSGQLPADSLISNGDEVHIMEAARTDLSQFVPLYERYLPRIYHYCLRRVENQDTAEDLTSIIFTRALTGLQQYNGGSVAGWLFRIAHNVVANHYRSRRPQVSLERSTLDVTDEGSELIEQFMQTEHYQQLQSLMAALPVEQQELLALRIEGELSAEEIGQMLGKSANAVRVELHRIIKRLRAQYLGRRSE